jgi:hypothetical protein
MKNVFLIACCLCVQLLHSQANRTLRIVYVDNYSESGSGQKGISSASLKYLFGEVDKYMEEYFLVYIPNGRKPIYSFGNKEEVNSILSDLGGENKYNMSNILFDKQTIYSQLAEINDLQFSKIECHIYASKEFIEENLINEDNKTGFFTTYFLRELQAAFHTDNVQFNYYHNEEDPKFIAKIETRLKERFSFYNNGIFEGKSEPIIHVINQ